MIKNMSIRNVAKGKLSAILGFVVCEREGERERGFGFGDKGRSVHIYRQIKLHENQDRNFVTTSSWPKYCILFFFKDTQGRGLGSHCCFSFQCHELLVQWNHEDKTDNVI